MKARHVIIRGQVYRWEEKAPFVKSGRSVRGAVEYDLSTNRCRCHHCGKWFARVDLHTSRAAGHPSTRDYKYEHGLRVSFPIGLKRVEPFRKLTPAMQKGCPPAEARQRAVKARAQRGGYRSYEETNERGLCHAQVVTSLQRIAAELGRVPTQTDAGVQLCNAAIRRYGSYARAILAADLRPTKIFNSTADLIEVLRDFYVLNQRLPKKTEWGGKSRLPDQSVYVRRFGSVGAAYREAGLGLVAQQSGRSFMSVRQPDTGDVTSSMSSSAGEIEVVQ